MARRDGVFDQPEDDRVAVGYSSATESFVTVAIVGSVITEDDVKRTVANWLEAQGFNVMVAWDRAPGIDMAARRNYFVGVIGNLSQRMTEEGTRYGLALPTRIILIVAEREKEGQ